MGSRLVYDLAVALGAAGFRAVRFDFRGVGRSDGAYGGGDGEVADAQAVFDSLRAEGSGGSELQVRGDSPPPMVIGYSLGGGVACRLAATRPVERLVLVATPARLTQSSLMPADDAPKVRAETLVIVGDRDAFVPLEDARALAAAFPTPAVLRVLEGAGHFLEPSHNARVVGTIRGAMGSPAFR